MMENRGTMRGASKLLVGRTIQCCSGLSSEILPLSPGYRLWPNEVLLRECTNQHHTLAAIGML